MESKDSSLVVVSRLLSLAASFLQSMGPRALWLPQFWHVGSVVVAPGP